MIEVIDYPYEIVESSDGKSIRLIVHNITVKLDDKALNFKKLFKLIRDATKNREALKLKYAQVGNAADGKYILVEAQKVLDKSQRKLESEYAWAQLIRGFRNTPSNLSHVPQCNWEKGDISHVATSYPPPSSATSLRVAQTLFEALLESSFDPLSANHEERRETHIPFKFPDGGCFIRANKACDILFLDIPSISELDGVSIKVKKIWIYDREYNKPHRLRVKTKNHPAGEVSWDYHVSPLVVLREGEFDKFLVLDPSISEAGPLTVENWLAEIGADDGKCEVYTSDKELYARTRQWTEEYRVVSDLLPDLDFLRDNLISYNIIYEYKLKNPETR